MEWSFSCHNSQVENRNFSDLKDAFGTNVENMHSKGSIIECCGNMTGFNFLDGSDICDNLLHLLRIESSRKRNLESLVLLLVGKNDNHQHLFLMVRWFPANCKIRVSISLLGCFSSPKGLHLPPFQWWRCLGYKCCPLLLLWAVLISWFWHHNTLLKRLWLIFFFSFLSIWLELSSLCVVKTTFLSKYSSQAPVLIPDIKAQHGVVCSGLG